MYVLQMARLALRRLVRDEDGATAVEYGLIVGLIAVVIVATLAAIGTDLNTIFGNVRDCLASSAACT
jgi:pilus assembly protein Flp/PilA